MREPHSKLEPSIKEKKKKTLHQKNKTTQDINLFDKEKPRNIINEIEKEFDTKNKSDIIYSPQLAELFFKSTHDLMMIIDTFGIIRRINDAGIAVSGFSKKELIGKRFWSIPGVFSKNNITSFLQVFKNSLQGKSTDNFTQNLHDKNGKEHVISFSTHPIKQKNKMKGLLVVGKDITCKKEIESKYELISRNTDAIIGITTLDTTYTFISPSIEKILGFTPEEFIGKKGIDCVHPEDKEKLLLILRKYVNKHGKKIISQKDSKLSETVKYRAQHKSGDWLLFEAIANIKNDQLILISKDITSEKQSQIQLEQAHKKVLEVNKKLEQKVSERTKRIRQLLLQKEEFIYQLGHDLKHPIGPLLNLIPILKKNETDEKKLELLDVIYRNTKYMKELITKTLELARLNSPNTKFHFESVNLSREIQEVIENNSNLFEEHNVEVENLLPKDIHLDADKLQIKELCTNIISNAIKYSDNNTSIMFDLKKGKNDITLLIKDQGIGLTKDEITHIFDEFYKADHTRNDFYSSGLGMTICKRIVEKHNGEIWAESDGIGKGTTISCKLPIRQDIDTVMKQ